MRLDVLTYEALTLATQHPLASIVCAFVAGMLSWVLTQSRSSP
jgi:hypothetical protein